MNRISLSLLTIIALACSTLALAGGLNDDLFLAVTNGDLAKASAAVSAGAKVDGEPGKMSPLYVAAFLGQTEIAEYLLENGADPTIINPSTGVTPNRIAALKGHHKLAELLKANGLAKIKETERLLQSIEDSENNRDCEEEDTVTFSWMGRTYTGPRGQVHEMENGDRVVADPSLPKNPKRKSCKSRP